MTDRAGRLATAVLVVAAGSGVGAPVVASLALVTPAGAAAPSCSASPAVAHYQVVTSADGVAEVSGVRLSGLSSACDGATAVLTIDGNAAGRPTASTTVLSKADSALDPCTGQAAHAGAQVRGGSIDLLLCPDGGPAGWVPGFEVTELSLMVGGATVPVTPGTSRTSASGAGGTNGSGTGAALTLGAQASSASSGTSHHHHRESSAASGSRTHHQLRAGSSGFDYLPWLLALLILGLLLLLLLWRRRRDEEEVAPPAA